VFKTEDGVVDITVAKDISDIVFQPADWSMVNIPLDPEKAERLANNLFNMPSHRHVSLVMNRHKRKERIKGLSALSAFDDKSWKFLDSITASYGKPSTCSNNGFLPLAEHAFLFYKGTVPDPKETHWASAGEYQNATNEWVLVPQDKESVYFKQTYYQKFSWDLQLLMLSLCGRGEHSRFIYGVSMGASMSDAEVRSLYTFCKKYNLTVELIVSDVEKAEEILMHIENANTQL